MASAQRKPQAGGGTVSTFEFVSVVAALMAINTLGIDIMLPALPHIAQALHFSAPNQQQLIITVYLIGSGALQIFFGPLSDRFGRRGLVIFCVLVFGAMSFLASFATSFVAIVAIRVLQGMGAAGTRVISVAMVRDRYAGSEMARVMSLAMMIFMLVPILAPSAGALLMLLGPWQGIFYFLAGLSVGLAAWIALRIPETLGTSRRRSIKPAQLVDGFRKVLSHRQSSGYTLAMCISMGGVVGYISSAQQIFTEALGGSEAFFSIFFGAVACGLIAASFANSRLVMRFGMHKVSHAVVPVYLLITGIHLAWALFLTEHLMVFAIFQFAMLFCLGLVGANFGAMAMEPMGDNAGMAAAVQGMASSIGGALIGLAIGQSFDGTATPVIAGNFVCSIGMFLAMLFAESRSKTPCPCNALD